MWEQNRRLLLDTLPSSDWRNLFFLVTGDYSEGHYWALLDTGPWQSSPLWGQQFRGSDLGIEWTCLIEIHAWHGKETFHSNIFIGIRISTWFHPAKKTQRRPFKCIYSIHSEILNELLNQLSSCDDKLLNSSIWDSWDREDPRFGFLRFINIKICPHLLRTDYRELR